MDGVAKDTQDRSLRVLLLLQREDVRTREMSVELSDGLEVEDTKAGISCISLDIADSSVVVCTCG